MTLLTRIFGGRKPAPVSTSRIASATAPRPADKLPEKIARARPTRTKIYREATIHLDSGYTRKGIVLDHSATGLRIRFPTHESLPRIVRISARSIGVDRRAQVVWQKGTEAGLKLL